MSSAAVVIGVLRVNTFRHSSLSFVISLPGQSPGRAIVLPPALVASALTKSLTLKFFYVMGKALSGELSCPCDRSCFISTIKIEALKRPHNNQ